MNVLQIKAVNVFLIVYFFFIWLNIYQSVILSYSKNGRNRYYRFIAGFKGVQGGGYPLLQKFYSFRQRETLWGNISLYADQFYI